MPRARKSLAEHELSGTAPEWTQDTGEPFVAGKPKMPADLPPAAQQEWKRLVKELSRRRTITRTDASALEMYCRMWARWKQALAEIEKYGSTIENEWTDQNGTVRAKLIESPASKLATRLENSLRAMLKEFSATPASREKTKRAAAPKKQELPEGSIGWIRQQMEKEAQQQAAQAESEQQPQKSAAAEESNVDLGYEV